jgi:predicted esterase
VIFASSSGGAGSDEANAFIAAKISAEGLGTCQFRIKEMSSADTGNAAGLSRPGQQFEIVGRALVEIATFLKMQRPERAANICLFASGDGSAAALYAAAVNPAAFSALVISGGRPTAALSYAARNTVPTLFISGSEDNIASAAAHAAYAAVRGAKARVIISGAGHRLREPGALEDAAKGSLTWFQKHGQA